jgi:hypothetical protein
MAEQMVLNPLTMTEGEFVDAIYQRALKRSDIEELKDDIVEFYNDFYAVQYWDILDSFDDKLLVNKKRSYNYNQIEQTCPTEHFIADTEFGYSDYLNDSECYERCQAVRRIWSEERHNLRVELGFENEAGVPTAVYNSYLNQRMDSLVDLILDKIEVSYAHFGKHSLVTHKRKLSENE